MSTTDFSKTLTYAERCAIHRAVRLQIVEACKTIKVEHKLVDLPEDVKEKAQAYADQVLAETLRGIIS
jgi:hypothetical protein